MEQPLESFVGTLLVPAFRHTQFAAAASLLSDLESSWRALRGAARQARCLDGRWWDVRVRETWDAREGRAVGRVGCVVVAVAWRSCRAVSAVGGRASHSEFSGLTNPAGLKSLR